MFEQLIASHTMEVRTGKSFTLVLSAGIHAIFILMLLVVPMFFPETAAGLQNVLAPLAPPLTAPPGTTVKLTSTSKPIGSRSILVNPRVLTAPPSIPKGIDLSQLGEPDPPSGGESFGPVLGSPSPVGSPIGIFGASPYQERAFLPRQPPPSVAQPERPLRRDVGGDVQQANLLHQVKPLYPATARTVRVQGAVVMEAVIDRAGRVENLRVLSGHPVLVPAALDAVRQWRYRPTLLNGEPVEVITLVTVNFILAH